VSKDCPKWYRFQTILFKLGVKNKPLNYLVTCNTRVISEGGKGGGKCADKFPSAHILPSPNLKAVDQWESQPLIVPLLSLAGEAQYPPPPPVWHEEEQGPCCVPYANAPTLPLPPSHLPMAAILNISSPCCGWSQCRPQHLPLQYV
jgi:hypothetical protein